jgi:NAD(P)-dependent dehydrogenase (short-subunit alcohol dehydrogenase family)
VTEAVDRLFSVSGKRVVITGGTRGIGLMIARGMTEAGARVVVASRKAEACRAVEAELGCPAVVADLNEEAGIEALVAQVEESFDGRLDVLFNNAGATWGAPLEEFPRAAWDRVLGVNLVGLFDTTVKLLPALRQGAAGDGPARVINIGSVDGLRVPADENYSYSAAKAGVHMLTRHLASRLAGENVTVNAIAPGPFESKMTAFKLEDETLRAEVEDLVPLGRIGAPDDIAGLAIFLSSRASAYMTGSIVPLDGGFSGCS